MDANATTMESDTGLLLPQQGQQPKRYFPSRSRRNERRKTAIAIFLFSVGLISFIMVVENFTLFSYDSKSPANASPKRNLQRRIICKKCNCTKELENATVSKTSNDSLIKNLFVSKPDDSFIENWTPLEEDSDSLLVKERTSINTSDGSWIKVDTFITEGIEQNDSRIVNYIQKNHLFSPIPKKVNPDTIFVVGNLRSTGSHERRNVFLFLKKILNNMTNGFFVEAGVLDGETTLALERDYSWRGLLIEPQPEGVLNLKSKNRKAWIANVCLSPTVIPSKLDFAYKGNRTIGNKLRASETDEESDRKPHRVQCFPFFSILSAVNVTTVDYLILSAQGNELKVLNTIPFDFVFIKIIAMEFDLVPEGKDAVKDFMKTKEYTVVKQLNNNYVFVHKSLNYNEAKKTELDDKVIITTELNDYETTTVS